MLATCGFATAENAARWRQPPLPPKVQTLGFPEGSAKFQQWDGKQWTVLTDWIAPDQALVRPLVEASAARYAQEKGITPRTCP